MTILSGRILRAPNQNWLQRWENNNIGWHHIEYNEHLLSHWSALALPAGSQVFAPLCGKSRDMVWLAQQGYQIRGVELSKIAVEAFFKEHHLHPKVARFESFERWTQGPYEIYCGDIFDMAQIDQSDINAVYDRASLVALNPQQRETFAHLLIETLPEEVKILLVTMAYPQSEMTGPPYSVSTTEVEELFESRFSITHLHTLDLLHETDRYADRGVSQMLEQIYLLE
jgi:thiopurine S-methyltransferase